jgi:hypothetical protein
VRNGKWGHGKLQRSELHFVGIVIYIEGSLIFIDVHFRDTQYCALVLHFYVGIMKNIFPSTIWSLSFVPKYP